jgi:hypothetical protein
MLGIVVLGGDDGCSVVFGGDLGRPALGVGESATELPMSPTFFLVAPVVTSVAIFHLRQQW